MEGLGAIAEAGHLDADVRGEVFGRADCMPSNKFMLVVKGLGYDGHRSVKAKCATSAGDMTEAQDRVASDIEVRVTCQAQANALCPCAVTVSRVHANHDRYIKEFPWIASFEYEFDISLCPTRIERSHGA